MFYSGPKFCAPYTLFVLTFLILFLFLSYLSESAFDILSFNVPLIQQAYASPININVRITSFSQTTNPDEPFHSNGDYYPTIRIGSNGIVGRAQAVDSASFSPQPTYPWSHSAAINRLESSRTVPIYINIYDRDDFPAATDHPMNINGENQYGQVYARLNVDTGMLTGDGIRGRADVNRVAGDTFTSSGPDATIRFKVSLNPGSAVRVANVVPDDDVDNRRPADLTINAHGTNVHLDPPQGNSRDWYVILNPGNYFITEAEDPAFTQDYSADCSGRVRAGEVKVCTIIHTEIDEMDNPNPEVPAYTPGQGGSSDGGTGGGAGPSSDIPGYEMPAKEGENLNGGASTDASGSGSGSGSGGAEGPSSDIPSPDMPAKEGENLIDEK